MNKGDKITIRPLEGGYQKSCVATIVRTGKTFVELDIPSDHAAAYISGHPRKFSRVDGLLVGSGKNDFPKWSIK